MVDFFDLLNDVTDSGADRLEEARLGDNPLALLVFTRDVEKALMHYVDDDAVHAYVVCPGKGCPLCRLGQRAKEFILLPVIDVATGTIRVLRISTRRGPSTLLDQLKPHLAAENSSDRLLLVARRSAAYHVDVEPLGLAADRCVAAVKRFQDEVEQGLQLASAFTQMTAEELAEIGRVKRLLELRGLADQQPDPE